MVVVFPVYYITMTPERIDAIYEAIRDKIITLHPNPTTQGPVYLQEMISRVRGYLNDVGSILQEILQDKHLAERRLRLLKTEFSIEADRLLLTEEVQSLSAIDDRRARVNNTLSEQRQAISDLENDVSDIEALEEVVKFRHKELNQTMSAIRLQKNLIDAEINTGAMFGDTTTTSRHHVGPSAPNPELLSDSDMQDISRFLSEELSEGEDDVESEVEEGADEVVEEDPVSSSESAPETQSVTHGSLDVEEDPSSSTSGLELFLDSLDSDDVVVEDEPPTTLSEVSSKAARRREWARNRPDRLDKKPNGLFCAVCGLPQFETTSGVCCDNGHGDAGGIKERPQPQPVGGSMAVDTKVSTVKEFDNLDHFEDFLNFTDISDFFEDS